MLLRIVLYLVLGIDAYWRHEFSAAAVCLITPFAGSGGMYLAVVAGALFAYNGSWIEALLAWGYLAACLYGNRRSRRARAFDAMSLSDMKAAAQRQGVSLEEFAIREVHSAEGFPPAETEAYIADMRQRQLRQRQPGTSGTDSV